MKFQKIITGKLELIQCQLKIIDLFLAFGVLDGKATPRDKADVTPAPFSWRKTVCSEEQ
jgi:hypothetical protein